ncbi:MAG: hypothetical protein WCJ64_17670, partial [Rhodospirillaceae bacterium]
FSETERRKALPCAFRPRPGPRRCLGHPAAAPAASLRDLRHAASLAVVAALVRRRPAAWAGRALALALAFHGLLVLLAVLRFGSWPNYLELNPYGWLWRLAASWRDAVALFFTEPLIELGHRVPDLGATEWQITLDPLGLPVILAASLLVSAFSLCRPQSRRRSDAVLLAAGAAVTALFSATLGWVACHAAPGWVLMLMSETNSGLALQLEPFGPLLTLSGLALMTGALLRRAG